MLVLWESGILGLLVTRIRILVCRILGIPGADLGILREGGGRVWAGILQGGVRVQVRRNFHILTSKKKTSGV